MTAGREESFSQHPVDQLIRELIRTGRAATPAEIEQIIERMATASFDPRAVHVDVRYRGLVYQSRVLRTRDDALFSHLPTRVVADHQWMEGTTAEQYLADLRRAISSPSARLAVYERRGGHLSMTLTLTADVVPLQHQSSGSLPWILAVYSADRGIILSGYQVSGLETAAVPGEARWLR